MKIKPRIPMRMAIISDILLLEKLKKQMIAGKVKEENKFLNNALIEEVYARKYFPVKKWEKREGKDILICRPRKRLIPNIKVPIKQIQKIWEEDVNEINYSFIPSLFCKSKTKLKKYYETLSQMQKEGLLDTNKVKNEYVMIAVTKKGQDFYNNNI